MTLSAREFPDQRPAEDEVVDDLDPRPAGDGEEVPPDDHSAGEGLEVLEMHLQGAGSRR